MAGYNTILKIRRLEEVCNRIGVTMTHADHYHKDYGDIVAVRPKDANSFPIYSRDAELFVGTLESLEFWLQGIQWARKYDSMLFGKTHDVKRERKEQDYRNQLLMSTLQDPKLSETIKS